ncbi:MAG: hypothetical protein KF866_10610 [Phycisphaeraceae bacterium]|nr:hypothetical protein [Phycisphaeraceae bacterium]MCW5754367.1 hypothetical protein [Phycisphaeraceae bacterium]
MSRMSTRSKSVSVPVKAKSVGGMSGETGRLVADVGGRKVTIHTTGTQMGHATLMQSLAEKQNLIEMNVEQSLKDGGANDVEGSAAYNRGQLAIVVDKVHGQIPDGEDATVVFVCQSGKVRSVTAACALYKRLLSVTGDAAFTAFVSYEDRVLWQDEIVKKSNE